MDEYLSVVLNWFSSLGIQNINHDKLKRQLSIISYWFKANCIGYFTAVTGFGKSLVAIITIYRLNLKYPDAITIIVVPSLKLYQDWQSHIETYGLKNVTVYVVNTYTSIFIETQTKWVCTLLIADEVHNYISENALQFNQVLKATSYKMFLGMSATLNEEEEATLNNVGIPCIDSVSMSEARRFNYISDYIIYNLGINLDEIQAEAYKKYNDIHNSNYSKFLYFVESDKNWELIRACGAGNLVDVKVGNEWRKGREWREWYANKMDWNGEEDHPWSPRNINKYAQQWNWAMMERKKLLYNAESKVVAAKAIINYLNVPTITFSETTDFADKLTLSIGEKARSYHSNLLSIEKTISTNEKRKNFKSAKLLRVRTNGILRVDEETKEYIVTYNKIQKVSPKVQKAIIISDFEDGKISVLNTARALDEGFNVENIACAIICSASSKVRQGMQRMGRALRFIEGKKAIIINLYLKDTQDEKWLKTRQKGETNIRWINDITEIL